MSSLQMPRDLENTTYVLVTYGPTTTYGYVTTFGPGPGSAGHA